MNHLNRTPYIERVDIIRPHVLKLHFDDGLVRTLEFIPGQGGQMFEPLDDPQYFAHVTVNHGTLAWPNGLDLDPVVLHGEREPVGTALFRELQSVMEVQPMPDFGAFDSGDPTLAHRVDELLAGFGED